LLRSPESTPRSVTTRFDESRNSVPSAWRYQSLGVGGVMTHEPGSAAFVSGDGDEE